MGTAKQDSGDRHAAARGRLGSDGDSLEESIESLNSRQEDQSSRQSWHRLKGETERAFAAFEIYRQLPAHTRTAAGAARSMGQSPQSLQRWTVANYWRARAVAWDEHAQMVRVVETENSIRAMAKKHVASLSYVEAITNAHLKGITEEITREQTQATEADEPYNPGQLNPDQLIKWVKTGQELESVRRAQLLALESGTAQDAVAALLSGVASTEEQWRAIYVDPERIWVPHSKQRDLVHSTARFCCAVAGVQSGKTSGCAICFWRRILDDRPRLALKNESGFYWLIAPNSLVGEVMCEAFEQFAPPGEIVEVKGRGSGRTWVLSDGARVQFRSAEKADTLVARRLHGCWLDEFTLMKPEVWTTSLRQRFATTGGWALFSGTPRGKNWAWEEIWRRTDVNDDAYDEDYEGFTWFSEENPRVSTKEIEAARRQLPPAYFEREYRASWESFHGQIYSDWDSDTCRVHSLALQGDLPGTYYVMGVDWGMATPGAAVVVRFLPTGARHVVDEIHVADKLPSWWEEKITELWSKWKCVRIWCDPEDPGRAGELVKLGLPALKADNAVLPGIRSVALLVTQGMLRSDHTEAPVFAQQMESYTWHEDSRGNRREFPKKGNDHAVDAGRYAIHSEETKEAVSYSRSGYKGNKTG